MTIKRYLASTDLEGEAVVAAIRTEGRPSLRLTETYFHVQGGGQKADRGTLGSGEIYDVRYADDGGIDHFVTDINQFEIGKKYPFSIDPAWRRLNSGYHSTAHLLAAVFEKLHPGTHATSGRKWPGEAGLEFELPSDDSGFRKGVLDSLSVLELMIVQEINNGMPIRIVGDPFVSRACQIGDYQPVLCGGTHLASTSEIGAFSIRSIKSSTNTVRVDYYMIPVDGPRRGG
jgi:Ser-tRNA(Ala) deacylase AlaX